MTPTDDLEEQLNATTDKAVAEIYRLLAKAHLPSGMVARPSSHGFIGRELRFETDGVWHYSAVLNQSWILWYFRRPAFRDGLIDMAATKAQFADHKDSGKGEIKLRISDIGLAQAVLDWIGAQSVSDQG
jgi:hypothetical protein